MCASGANMVVRARSLRIKVFCFEGSDKKGENFRKSSRPRPIQGAESGQVLRGARFPKYISCLFTVKGNTCACAVRFLG